MNADSGGVGICVIDNLLHWKPIRHLGFYILLHVSRHRSPHHGSTQFLGLTCMVLDSHFAFRWLSRKRFDSDGPKKIHKQKEECKERLNEAVIEFRKAQCLFMIAIQITALRGDGFSDATSTTPARAHNKFEAASSKKSD